MAGGYAGVPLVDDKCGSCSGKGWMPTGHVGDAVACWECAGTGTNALRLLFTAVTAFEDVNRSRRTTTLTPEGVLNLCTERYKAIRDAFERLEREVCKLLMDEQAGTRKNISDSPKWDEGLRKARLAEKARLGEGADPAPVPQRRLEDAQALIAAECDRVKEILLAKNKAYGNAALDPVRIFSKAPADEQIKVRIDDKVNRIWKGEDAGEDVVLDLIGYFMLWRVHTRMQAGS